MAIYDIFDAAKQADLSSSALEAAKRKQIPSAFAENENKEGGIEMKRGRFFSSLAARLFFLLLLIADLFWAIYAIVLLVYAGMGRLVTVGKLQHFLKVQDLAWISLRRSLVCGVSLFIALFSPSFGIMVACTYFLMYDKSGIEEVVPSSLQAQFEQFFPKEESAE